MRRRVKPVLTRREGWCEDGHERKEFFEVEYMKWGKKYFLYVQPAHTKVAQSFVVICITVLEGEGRIGGEYILVSFSDQKGVM